MQGAMVETRPNTNQGKNPPPQRTRETAVPKTAIEAVPHYPRTPKPAPPIAPKGVKGFMMYLLSPEDSRESLINQGGPTYDPRRFPGIVKTLFWMSLAILGTILLGQLS